MIQSDKDTGAHWKVSHWAVCRETPETSPSRTPRTAAGGEGGGY